MSLNSPAAARRAGARWRALLPACVALVIAAALAWSGIALAQSTATPAPTDPWPRQMKLPIATALVYQPQVDCWQATSWPFALWWPSRRRDPRSPSSA